MTAPAAFRRYQAPSQAAIDVVLEAIASRTVTGKALAEILPRLVVEAGKLGELVEYDAIIGGVTVDEEGNAAPWRDQVTGRGMRAEWFERLAAAIQSGALKGVSVERAVEILLQPKP